MATTYLYYGIRSKRPILGIRILSQGRTTFHIAVVHPGGLVIKRYIRRADIRLANPTSVPPSQHKRWRGRDKATFAWEL
jgi:hypothetical protein